MKVTRITIGIVLSCWTAVAWSQSTDEAVTKEGELTFETDKPFKLLDIGEAEKDPIPIKKRRRKRGVFYGIKTRKGFVREGYGQRETTQRFHYLKKPDLPSHFIRDIYWYDFSRNQIRKTKKFDPEKGVLLHGPYRKTQNKKLLEEGIFYKGTKHGRWMRYDTRGVLISKNKYYKGWPKESLILYYDPMQKTKIKEMIPMEHGEREGYYYQFHKNGTTAVLGEYKWNHKVGRWVENYATGNLKKIIVYPNDPFEKDHKPFIKSEWDESGKQLYSSRKRQ